MFKHGKTNRASGPAEEESTHFSSFWRSGLGGSSGILSTLKDEHIGKQVGKGDMPGLGESLVKCVLLHLKHWDSATFSLRDLSCIALKLLLFR
ncbi:hypothetical protein NPIL_417151 [Nephila pilipes]|uniref:Uncharacterized protein n=1 Tax=Nephila pilipes TaxID=299642 RepID=A0A8X6JQJ3_NEPPI|nr:hypothetical protein NPIL_417151 [Nephila pilipes]